MRSVVTLTWSQVYHSERPSAWSPWCSASLRFSSDSWSLFIGLSPNIYIYDIWWTILTCAQKLTSSQLSLPHRTKQKRTRMWANAQPDGRPAEYRWRPLLNAAVWLTRTTRVQCSNAAKTRNPLKLAGMPQTNETISAASRPKFTILWGTSRGDIAA